MTNQQVMPLGHFLKAKEANISQALPATCPITAKRVMRIVMNEAAKNKELLKCTQETLLSSVLECCRLGLEPGSALGHAYLLPFRNAKKGTTDCQFLLGYRGMIELARRSGQIVSIYSHAVYENDEFEITFGLREDIKHKPATGEKGKIMGAYAVAHLKDGGHQLDWMSKYDIDLIRQRSKAGESNYSPWATDYQEMAKKTVLRRLFKYLPISTEAQRLVVGDEAADRGEQLEILTIDNDFIDSEIPSSEPPKSQSDALAEKI